MKHLKVFWLWIKETHKRFWCYWLGFTDLDEKTLAAYAEARRRYSNVKEELKDAVDAAKGK